MTSAFQIKGTESGERFQQISWLLKWGSGWGRQTDPWTRTRTWSPGGPQDSGSASRSWILKDGGGSHPCPDAHGHHAVRPASRKTETSESGRVLLPPPPPHDPARPPSSPPELVEQRHHLAGSGAAQRVSQGDGPAVRVDLVQRDSQRLHAVDRLEDGDRSEPKTRVRAQDPGQSPGPGSPEAEERSSPGWRRPR